tara:strand:+ start:145 stop:555 length:411 start_codon:yes stop_codon:yes gene_type:complete
MKHAIIIRTAQFNSKYYAIFKQLHGFGSRMQELFGTSAICIGKATGCISAPTKTELWKEGNVFSNVELVPLEKFEMEMQPLYNADNELVGNIAKPSCQVVVSDECKLVTNIPLESIEDIAEVTDDEPPAAIEKSKK